MRSLDLLAVFLGLCGSAFSANIFNRPPSGGLSGDYRENPTYKANEPVEFLWDTDYPFVDVVVFQKYPAAPNGGFYTAYVVENTSRTSYSWTARMSVGGSEPPEGEKAIYWLVMYNVSSSVAKITDSHYFNVSRELTSTSSQSTSSQTTTSTSTISTASASSTADAQSSGALSTGAVAGIAVGATLAGVLLLALCAFFLWKKMQAKKDANAAANTPVMDASTPAKPTSEFGQSAGSPQPPNYLQAQNTPQMRSEVPATVRSEVPANPLCEAP